MKLINKLIEKCTMDNFLILTTILFLLIIFTSCDKNTPIEVIQDKSNIKTTFLMPQVGHGLTKVELNDSTTILIYRGVESSAMIQLK